MSSGHSLLRMRNARTGAMRKKNTAHKPIYLAFYDGVSVQDDFYLDLVGMLYRTVCYFLCTISARAGLLADNSYITRKGIFYLHYG